MSKNPSERNRTASDTPKAERDSWRRGPKFVTDEDIAGRKVAHYRELRSMERKRSGEPKFVSDDDIVQPRVA